MPGVIRIIETYSDNTGTFTIDNFTVVSKLAWAIYYDEMHTHDVDFSWEEWGACRCIAMRPRAQNFVIAPCLRSFSCRKPV